MAVNTTNIPRIMEAYVRHSPAPGTMTMGRELRILKNLTRTTNPPDTS